VEGKLLGIENGTIAEIKAGQKVIFVSLRLKSFLCWSSWFLVDTFRGSALPSQLQPLLEVDWAWGEHETIKCLIFTLGSDGSRNAGAQGGGRGAAIRAAIPSGAAVAGTKTSLAPVEIVHAQRRRLGNVFPSGQPQLAIGGKFEIHFEIVVALRTRFLHLLGGWRCDERNGFGETPSFRHFNSGGSISKEIVVVVIVPELV
jgi:hypothetical protein